VTIFGGLVVLGVTSPRMKRERSLSGAVLTSNEDPRKQLPIPNVEVTADAGGTPLRTRTDATGFFRLTWRARLWLGETLTIQFRHPDYQPVQITKPLTNDLLIARLTPSVAPQDTERRGSEVSLSNIRVRYSVNVATTITAGSTVQTLEVINTGNVPCNDRPPCSPDGKWKATIGHASLNAGNGQEFQNVRVSCIAGPCPFTKIEADEFSHGGPRIDVSVRAWSDTVVFLVEAEVVRMMRTDAIRQAYPSLFGRDMTFTLPATGEGPSIEADVDGTAIVFPLGPNLSLSWASCSVQVARNSTKLYSCSLKPGYRFR
jgi:hypothetical protein